MATLKNTVINDTGYFKIPAGTTAQRPVSPSNGMTRYNTDNASMEYYSEARTAWVVVSGNDGSSAATAAPSGYYIAQNYPGRPSGWYWIKSPSMPNALQMYVDMTEEGGGYDFYPISGGISTTYKTETHSGISLGLDLVYPRSKYHWRAMRNFVSNVLGSTDYTYFNCVSGIYKTTAGGNYTTYIMRSPTHYGSGAPDWRVGDGGRWWLRDTTYTEPNGDYAANAWLGDLNNRNGLPNGYNLQDLLFNDGTSSYSTGSNYLVSTNAKP